MIAERLGMPKAVRAVANACVEACYLGDQNGRALHLLGPLAGRVLHEYGRDLLVMPGGEQDTWRPYHKRYAVNFAGRTGYARLALTWGVPIVPRATKRDDLLGESLALDAYETGRPTEQDAFRKGDPRIAVRAERRSWRKCATLW